MRISPDQWRYQKLAEALAKMIREDQDFISQDGRLEEFLLSAFNKIYKMGFRVADPVVQVTDLSDILELIERAKDRWKNGLCH